jgi:hypothetical protein|tara:strand:- start:126 stop:638 length:513 start_codon:yes stop_codon:yes gene_type:complete
MIDQKLKAKLVRDAVKAGGGIIRTTKPIETVWLLDKDRLGTSRVPRESAQYMVERGYAHWPAPNEINLETGEFLDGRSRDDSAKLKAGEALLAAEQQKAEKEVETDKVEEKKPIPFPGIDPDSHDSGPVNPGVPMKRIEEVEAKLEELGMRVDSKLDLIMQALNSPSERD